MKRTETQNILSIGYVYLVLIGIAKESIYYGHLDFNVLSYSSILDVLLSPIIELASSYASLGFFLLIILLVLIVPKTLAKRKHPFVVNKLLKLDASAKTQEIEKLLLRGLIIYATIMLFGFFIGRGVKHGQIVSEKIASGKIEYDDKIYFVDEVAAVEIVGKNSMFVFYLESGSDGVKISPLSGVVKSIEEQRNLLK